MPNKRGQVGETITWIVATIIIIVILLVSIIIVSVFPKKDESYLKLVDKQKDFIATKSVVNFLIENFDLVRNFVESQNYEPIEEKFRPFLESLLVFRGIGGWNFELLVEEKVESSIIISATPGWHNYYDIYFNLESNKIKLRFWEDCQGTCQ